MPTTQPRLFPGLPDDEPGASYTRRLTLRRLATIAAGRHPATGRTLLRVVDPPRAGLCCGDCRWADYQPGGSRWFWKCRRALGGVTRGPASDIRVSWPACTLFDPAQIPAPRIQRGRYPFTRPQETTAP